MLPGEGDVVASGDEVGGEGGALFGEEGVSGTGVVGAGLILGSASGVLGALLQAATRAAMARPAINWVEWFIVWLLRVVGKGEIAAGCHNVGSEAASSCCLHASGVPALRFS